MQKEYIFISYRRDDSSGHAGRFYDHLTERRGKGAVFMDIDAIPSGEKFDDYINERLANCFLCIAIIGPRWNTDRLKSPDDYVRKELAAALVRHIRVVPVLVDGARLPDPSVLPEDIRELTQYQAYDFGSGRDFRSQVQRLLSDVDRAVKDAREREQERAKEALHSAVLRPNQYPIWVLSICALIALSVLSALQSVPASAKALASLWEAQAADSRGDLANATLQYRQTLASIPTSRDAKIGLAISLFKMKSKSEDSEAFSLLEGIEIQESDWNKLVLVMPSQYKELFEIKRKK
jgi:hypothetical protein